MKTFSFLLVLTTVASSLSLSALGQVVDRDVKNGPSRNRLSLSSRFGFNIKANFESITTVTTPGPATGGAANRLYQNGYVLADSSGSVDDLTWNWGYSDISQLELGNDRIFMSGSTTAAPGVLRDKDDDPQYGFELTYARELGRYQDMEIGIEAAFGLTDLGLSGQTVHTTDAFALGGIIAPTAPYSGSLNGPGPLIGSAPTRGTTTTMHKLDATLFGWRLGPYVEVPLSKRISASVGGGFALGLIDSDYEFTQTTSVGGLASVPLSGAESRDELMYGGYVGGQFSWAVNERLNLFTGAYYQNLGKFSQRGGSNQATIDLGESVFLNLGFSLSF